jgi:hypothetical protein
MKEDLSEHHSSITTPMRKIYPLCSDVFCNQPNSLLIGDSDLTSNYERNGRFINNYERVSIFELPTPQRLLMRIGSLVAFGFGLLLHHKTL